MKEIKTKRYNIQFEETAKGGPRGYESVYLTSEGEELKKEFYDFLDGTTERFLPSKNRALRHRNGETLFAALEKGQNVGIASGFKPSGAYHFGHKLISSAVAFFQKIGTQIFVPVADLECMFDKKIDQEKSRFWAADNLVDWGANGVDLDASHVYLQSEEFRVSNLAYLLARGITFDLAVDTYGLEKLCGNSEKVEDKGEFPFLFAGITQVGDIVLPQHNDFRNDYSFMLSGQDQDGHMKMTVELVKRSLEQGVTLPGIKNIPSGLYIPHIRGLTGNKQSSSRVEGTLYLGPGPNSLDLDGRIANAHRIIDKERLENPEATERCALDMVKYIGYFNAISKIDLPLQALKIKSEIHEISPANLDSYLIGESKKSGQDNVAILRNNIADALKEHQQKRAEVIRYAIQRSELKDSGAWSSDQAYPEKPSFWNVPSKAVVDETRRNATKWYDMVAAMKERLIA
ncbi:MAG: hypothetical protein AABW75_04590 [Nanoarchaeota archaeon]